MKFESTEGVLRSLGHVASWSLLVLAGCSEIAGIEALPCTPACRDETTRVFCDADGRAKTEECPASPEECAAPACDAGACTFKPAVGAPCGGTETAQCNEGFACLGATLQMSALHRHTCLRADDGRVWCWGDNGYGQLGDGTRDPGLHPVLVRGLPGRAINVQTGYGHTCATLQTGEAYCWGNNYDGQCGVPPSAPISAPVLVPAPGIHFVAVVAAEAHSCGVTLDQTIYCWGNTELGQCGSDPAATGQPIVGPTEVRGLDSVVSFTSVRNHSCAVRSNEPTLKCWGSNSHVELPYPSYVNGKLGPAADNLPYSAAPITVALESPAFYVAMGVEATYALTQGGLLYAWGENDRFQLGIESREPIVRTPTSVKRLGTDGGIVPLARVFIALRTSGPDHCVGLADRTDFGTLFLCWGTDDWGELGVGTEQAARTPHPYPLPVQAVPSTANSLLRGEDHACSSVLRVDGRFEIRCYGRPGFLGNGTEPVSSTAAPSQWEGTPVIWKPENFAPAFE
jgi:alpha-tubulin suppressor-like RCC1 family protein